MRMRSRAACVLLGSLALLGGTVQSARAALLAVTFENKLISIDTTTGVGTLIGNLGVNALPFGLGFRGDDLYSYDQTQDLLIQIDPTTGAVIDDVDIGAGDLNGEGALDFRSDGIGFLANANGTTGQLFSFDVTVPSSTPITGVGGLSPSMDGLAFDSADVLYGLSQSSSVLGNSSLYTINTTTGVTTLVGSLGLSGDYNLGGLTFDSDGTLYAAVSLSDASTPSYLYKVDKSTGAATIVGNGIGFNGVSGLAAKQTPIPEPSSLVLAGLGVAGLIGVGVRKGRRRG